MSESRKTNGVVLVVHGLNNKPSVMNPLSEWLEVNNFQVVRVALAGHSNESRNELLTVQRSSWLKDLNQGYQRAKELASASGGPTYLLAYSLGALVSLDFFSGAKFGKDRALSEPIEFEKMILFAPALVPRIYVDALRSFKGFPDKFIPSKAPIDYRAHSQVPIAIYNALFDCMDHAREQIDQRLNIPTMIFIDPSDELISMRGLFDFIEKKKLTQWSLNSVSVDESTLETSYHHLIIDDRAVGQNQWRVILGQIKHFLAKDDQGIGGN